MRGEAILLTSILLVGVVAVLPTASALPACRDSATAGAGGHYVQAAGIRTKVWKESNGVPGLQTTSCTYHGVTKSADTFVREAVPTDLGILGVCAFTPVLSQCF